MEKARRENQQPCNACSISTPDVRKKLPASARTLGRKWFLNGKVNIYFFFALTRFNMKNSKGKKKEEETKFSRLDSLGGVLVWSPEMSAHCYIKNVGKRHGWYGPAAQVSDVRSPRLIISSRWKDVTYPSSSSSTCISGLDCAPPSFSLPSF